MGRNKIVDKVAHHSEALQRMEAFLRSRAADKMPGTLDLVRVARLDEGLLQKLWKMKYGVTMRSFHFRCKMELALHIVETEFLMRKEYADRVSADDDCSFNVNFKKAHGVSVLEARKFYHGK